MHTTTCTSLLLTACLCSAYAVQVQADGFTDDFGSLANLHRVENVARRRDFPPVVTRPDVRINRLNADEYKDSESGLATGYSAPVQR